MLIFNNNNNKKGAIAFTKETFLSKFKFNNLI